MLSIIWKGLEPAVVRAWALANGLPVGARGAIPAAIYNAYIRALSLQAARRAALGGAQVALHFGPELVRTVRRRRPES